MSSKISGREVEALQAYITIMLVMDVVFCRCHELIYLKANSIVNCSTPSNDYK
jgi:hypothetical protein